MKTPNITLFTPDYPPAVGGVARYLSNLVAVSQGSIEVIDTRPLMHKAWPQWWQMVKAIREVGSGKGEVVLVSHVVPVGTAAWISKIFGGPEYVILFHGLDIRNIRSLWKKWLVRHICYSAKAIFCNSDSTKNEVEKIVPRTQMTVLTPGVEARNVVSRTNARRSLNVDEQAKIVLSIARLIPRKGIDASLHALARIQHEQHVHYVVIGDGPDKVRLQKIAEESHVNCKWILNATEEEKWLWLSAADVFLLPVRDDGTDVEGFGIVYLEAALAGVPSVAGKSGGAPEAVRHERTGIVVKPTSIDEIQHAVQKLLDDESLRARLGDEARQRVLKDFRWEDRWVRLAKVLGINPNE